MKFEARKPLIFGAALCSFICAATTLAFGALLIIFPDFIASFFGGSFWAWVTVNARLFTVIYVGVSAALQIAAGVFMILIHSKKEEEFKTKKVMYTYIAVIASSAVSFSVITLGFLIVSLFAGNKIFEEDKFITEKKEKLIELKQLSEDGKISKEEFEEEAGKLIDKNENK